MNDRIKELIGNYWPSFSAVLVLLLAVLLDITGIQDFNLSPLAWVQLAIIVVLLVIQAVKPQGELNKYLYSRPKIDVIKVYSKKNVPTTDFVVKDSFTEEITDRYSGGTILPTEYKHAFRTKYGSTDNSETETTEQTYALVDFSNNPNTKSGIHNAERVIARINYYDEKGNNILGHEVKGIWSQNPEPSRIINPQPDYILAEIDIPANGDERSLCVALKNRNEIDCYAYSANSYSKSVFLKRSDMKMGTGTIIVKVVLSGVNVDDIHYCFRLINPGQGRDIVITKIDCDK